MAGCPSEGQYFIFNGDFVDRGAWGIETLLLLLAWKLALPHRAFLLRGNHECTTCTIMYGFQKELVAKYGKSHWRVSGAAVAEQGGGPAPCRSSGWPGPRGPAASQAPCRSAGWPGPGGPAARH